MEQGIAGYVATNSATLNIPDAYDHPQFNQAIDKKSGMCCVFVLVYNVSVGVGLITTATTTATSTAFNTCTHNHYHHYHHDHNHCRLSH